MENLLGLYRTLGQDKNIKGEIVGRARSSSLETGDKPVVIRGSLSAIENRNAVPMIDLGANCLMTLTTLSGRDTRLPFFNESVLRLAALERHLGKLPTTYTVVEQGNVVRVFSAPSGHQQSTSGSFVQARFKGWIDYFYTTEPIAELPSEWLEFYAAENVDVAVEALIAKEMQELNELVDATPTVPTHAVRMRRTTSIWHNDAHVDLFANQVITDNRVIERLEPGDYQPAAAPFCPIPLRPKSLRFEEPFHAALGPIGYIDAKKGHVIENVDEAFAAKLARMGAQFEYARPAESEKPKKRARTAA